LGKPPQGPEFPNFNRETQRNLKILKAQRREKPMDLGKRRIKEI